jgi:hypothetical protein
LVIRSAAVEPATQQIEFFEKKIRPLFADRCYACHSEKAEKLKGGFRLDTPEMLLKGGTSGAAIVPGDPDASLLIKAVRYTDPDLQMPPKNKKLPEEEITSLETWVKMGAPLPRSTGGAHRLTEVVEARARHWAFQAVKKPAPPRVKRDRWVQTAVDNFVLAMLEKKNLTPAPAADRRTLIRRVTYDLLGLPPTNEEVEAFHGDKRPDAYERLVERLLASPHYGERWARYWMDVARYGDTKGYLAGGAERRYAFSYTYRDYLIRAFNEDKPYDRFLIEQIAADLLLGAPASLPESSPNKQLAGKDAGAAREDKSMLTALGFLTLGRRFQNNENDIIDDRIDVVTRGTLGLTVACARCHDHKFDPIPTKDYYALHGVFASSQEPAELPLLGPLRDSPDYQDYLKQKAKIEVEIADFTAKEVASFTSELRQHVGDYLLGAHDATKLKDPSKFDTFAGERKLNPTLLRRWMSDLEARSKKPDPIFGPWFELAKLAETDSKNDFPTKGKLLLDKLAADPAIANSVVAKALAKAGSASLKDSAEVYNKVFEEVDSEWKAALAAATNSTSGKSSSAAGTDARQFKSLIQDQSASKDQNLRTSAPTIERKPCPTALASPEREALRQVLYAEGTPINLPKAEAEAVLARLLSDKTAPIRNKIEALNWTHPGAPPRAMALGDRAKPRNSHVFKRGNPGSLGEEVPRRFLEILSEPGRPPFTNGSGRLDLARAIASPNNPLTARVYVNRVWLHHFGEGLVSSAGDFGVRTEEPPHRGLLDYLAASFVESGWSTKSLHRLILLSATYQQSSDPQPASLRADPDNRLLSHMNRQRLDFEALRDTLLAIGSKLDQNLGGLPVDIETEPFTTRRTIYGLIERQNLPAIFRTFDFANPDTSNQGRFRTTVPQQALFLMNSPFVIEQARNLAQRSEVKGAASRREKIQALHRLVFQRPAAPAEIQLGEKFIGAQPQTSDKISPLEKYAQVLLLSNEVMFVD